ncbi:MAG TPA: class I SAM-dependent methyltransferase [Solirubrobacteraceae bacterium]|nr:class I SAM-dependent methyltransferase [Solirubrobacteraceae bacterium]
MGDPLLDPQQTRREYASETRLLSRASIYAGSEGPDTNDLVVELVGGLDPRSILEIGCGPGILADRLRAELGLPVTAIDISERMVQLAQARGIEAQLGDVQQIPFPDASFDLAIAAWMLYHVPDLHRALGEVKRILRPAGRFVAVTNSARHLEEMWRLIGWKGYRLSFNAENGAAILRRHFDRVERRDVLGTVTFSDADMVRGYVGATIKARELVDTVPELPAPLVARRHNAIFIATK